jgi:hypothetical protein
MLIYLHKQNIVLENMKNKGAIPIQLKLAVKIYSKPGKMAASGIVFEWSMRKAAGKEVRDKLIYQLILIPENDTDTSKT